MSLYSIRITHRLFLIRPIWISNVKVSYTEYLLLRRSVVKKRTTAKLDHCSVSDRRDRLYSHMQEHGLSEDPRPSANMPMATVIPSRITQNHIPVILTIQTLRCITPFVSFDWEIYCLSLIVSF